MMQSLCTDEIGAAIDAEVDTAPDFLHAYEAADVLVARGAHAQISLHNVTFDDIDETWTLQIIPSDGGNFVSARKTFGVFEVVAINVKRASGQ